MSKCLLLFKTIHNMFENVYFFTLLKLLTDIKWIKLLYFYKKIFNKFYWLQRTKELVSLPFLLIMLSQLASLLSAWSICNGWAAHISINPADPYWALCPALCWLLSPCQSASLSFSCKAQSGSQPMLPAWLLPAPARCQAQYKRRSGSRAREDGEESDLRWESKTESYASLTIHQWHRIYHTE